MANTKNQPHKERKSTKRASRKAFKASNAALTYKQRKEMRKAAEDGKTTSEFIRELATAAEAGE